MHVPALAIDMAKLAANLVLVIAIFVPLERAFAARRTTIMRPAWWRERG